MNTAVNEYNYRFKLTDYSLFDRNRARKVAIYGRVSTEHEAQLSALENQLQWYDDQVKYHPNWTVCERYIDEGITGTQAKKRPAFLKMIEDAKQGKFDLIVTREVCRFARNVVDTLVVTRELKGIGVEVFFIDDNIWTMDGDGELRLSLMATLAQEESRKTSERVKAGQKISRDNGVLYGNGNILGYDRVGDTYVINEEQAETVRMIYDLYLQGYGSMKIAKILTERKRKTASGLIKWSVSNIMRAIKNATYTGTKCYNKSRSNNFLEQKRINNLDMSTYEYVEGDFPSIISQEIWNKAQAIRESRVKPVCVSAGKNTHSKRDSRDIWVNKLRCSCGSSYRKNKWHTKLDGKTSYGYQCYNQLNNGIKRKRAEIGLDTEGYCDSRMITDWKLDFMAKALLEHLWTERKESVLIALDLIKYYYKEEKSNETQSDTVTIQAKLDKANSRLTNLIAMRADGEISKDEYQAMRSPVDEEIKKLQKALDEIPQEKSNPKGLDIEGIRSTLNSFIDFSGSTISHDVVNQFVYLITPTSDTTFDWYVNLNGTADVKATFTAEGRKKNCIIKLEEIEKISSVHREKNEDNAHFIKNPHIFTYLHIWLLVKIVMTFIPEKSSERLNTRKPLYLDGNLILQPAAALEMTAREVIHCSDMVGELIPACAEAFKKGDSHELKELEEETKAIAGINDAIMNYLANLFSAGVLTEKQSAKAASLLSVMTEIDRINTQCRIMTQYAEEKNEKNYNYSESAMSDIAREMKSVGDMYENAVDMIRTGNTQHMETFMLAKDRITDLDIALRKAHMKRVKEGLCDSELTAPYTRILNVIDRISNCCLNIAESAKNDNVSFEDFLANDSDIDSEPDDEDEGGIVSGAAAGTV